MNIIYVNFMLIRYLRVTALDNYYKFNGFMIKIILRAIL